MMGDSERKFHAALRYSVGSAPYAFAEPAAVHKKRDGLLLVRSDHSSVYLTFWESLLFRLRLTTADKLARTTLPPGEGR